MNKYIKYKNLYLKLKFNKLYYGGSGQGIVEHKIALSQPDDIDGNSLDTIHEKLRQVNTDIIIKPSKNLVNVISKTFSYLIDLIEIRKYQYDSQGKENLLKKCLEVSYLIRSILAKLSEIYSIDPSILSGITLLDSKEIEFYTMLEQVSYPILTEDYVKDEETDPSKNKCNTLYIEENKVIDKVSKSNMNNTDDLYELLNGEYQYKSVFRLCRGKIINHARPNERICIYHSKKKEGNDNIIHNDYLERIFNFICQDRNSEEELTLLLKNFSDSLKELKGHWKYNKIKFCIKIIIYCISSRITQAFGFYIPDDKHLDFIIDKLKYILNLLNIIHNTLLDVDSSDTMNPIITEERIKELYETLAKKYKIIHESLVPDPLIKFLCINYDFDKIERIYKIFNLITISDLKLRDVYVWFDTLYENRTNEVDTDFNINIIINYILNAKNELNSLLSGLTTVIIYHINNGKNILILMYSLLVVILSINFFKENYRIEITLDFSAFLLIYFYDILNITIKQLLLSPRGPSSALLKTIHNETIDLIINFQDKIITYITNKRLISSLSFFIRLLQFDERITNLFVGLNSLQLYETFEYIKNLNPSTLKNLLLSILNYSISPELIRRFDKFRQIKVLLNCYINLYSTFIYIINYNLKRTNSIKQSNVNVVFNILKTISKINDGTTKGLENIKDYFKYVILYKIIIFLSFKCYTYNIFCSLSKILEFININFSDLIKYLCLQKKPQPIKHAEATLRNIITLIYLDLREYDRENLDIEVQRISFRVNVDLKKFKKYLSDNMMSTPELEQDSESIILITDFNITNDAFLTAFRRKFKINKVPHDNNCLFNSIGLNIGKSATEVRQEICNYLQHYISDSDEDKSITSYESPIISDTVTQDITGDRSMNVHSYLYDPKRGMCTVDQWGGIIEIYAAAALYGRPIYVIVEQIIDGQMKYELTQYNVMGMKTKRLLTTEPLLLHLKANIDNPGHSHFNHLEIVSSLSTTISDEKSKPIIDLESMEKDFYDFCQFDQKQYIDDWPKIKEVKVRKKISKKLIYQIKTGTIGTFDYILDDLKKIRITYCVETNEI